MPRRRKEENFWVTRCGPGGWASVVERKRVGPSPRSESFLVRVEPDDGRRYRIVELHLHSSPSEPVTAARLRAVRISAIEQLLNLPEEREALAARFDERKPGKVYEAFMNAFVSDFTLPRPRDYEAVSEQPTPDSTTLSPPKSRGYPDEFYERVRDTYRDAFRRDVRPVAAVATEAGVPRSTAARWVKEARRRGLLGPAPATGKAGE